LNRSEVFVSKLCTKSFLSLWGYPNPKGKDSGKELCDFLVVCDPDVIIFSVKEIELKEGKDELVNWRRWQKKAIDESVKQIYGAERFIANSSNVVTNNSQVGLEFPEFSRRRIHRIAVALGGRGKAPIYFGDLGKGFVHTFDEVSLQVLMSQLDTITDFVNYLLAKEELFRSGKIVVFAGGEEDLLALYLHNNREFPQEFDTLILESDLWKGIREKPEYLAKLEADKDSYYWDKLIERQYEDYRIAGASALNSDLSHNEGNISLSTFEKVLRAMAKENRFCRRLLGRAFIEFAILASQKKIKSRVVPSPSGVQYIFLRVGPSENLKPGLQELTLRCHVARGLNLNHKTVIGIVEQEIRDKGFNLNFLYSHQEDWTGEDQVKMERIQKELGYFSDSIKTESYETEYPSFEKDGAHHEQ